MNGGFTFDLMIVFEFIYLLKITTFYFRREDPTNLYKWEPLWGNSCCGWGNNFNLIFIVGFIIELLFYDRWLRYFGDNSVISLKSSYWMGGLRPRCWIRSTRGGRSFQGWTVRSLNSYMIWVQVGVSQTGFYLDKWWWFGAVREDLLLVWWKGIG